MARSGTDDTGEKCAAIAANRLDTGAMVWLGADGAWHRRFAAAALFPVAEAEAALAAAKHAASARDVIDPGVIEVTTGTGEPVPARPRERIRALGPSVRPDLGYQAGQFD